MSEASVSVKNIVDSRLMEDMTDIIAASPVRRCKSPENRCVTPVNKTEVSIKKTEDVIFNDDFDKKNTSQQKVVKQIETSLESAMINNQKISMEILTVNNQSIKEENKMDFDKPHLDSSLSSNALISLKSNSNHTGSSHKSHKEFSLHSKSNNGNSHKRKHERSTSEGSFKLSKSSTSEDSFKLSKSHHDHKNSSSRHHHRSRHSHDKVRNPSVGVQCRRDKTLPKIDAPKSSPVEVAVKEPEKVQDRLSQATSGVNEVCRYMGFSLANPMESLAGCHGFKWGHLMMVEVYPNGGGKVLHMWQEDLDKLTEDENNALAEEFVEESFREGQDGFAIYCCAIVHNAAKGLPDFLEYLGDEHSSMPIKHSIIGHHRDMETCSMLEYRERVREHYKDGTFRFGFLDNISLVGAVAEEAGGFLPDILDMLEEIPILNLTMPWGERSTIPDVPRNQSNDGPILWIRPGEQSIPTMEMGKSPLKRRRNPAINELHNLKYLPRSTVEREILFEDRTPAHADHVGFGLDRATTAAVGVLKSVHCGENVEYNRIAKDTICFRASDIHHLTEKLLLDLHKPPTSQCPSWLDEGKLNQLYREGVRYAKVNLSDNDIYFLPRNIVHQFRTVTATTSIAWHCRLTHYDDISPASPPTLTEASSTEEVKEEPGSGSEKENQNRPSKKCRRIVSSSDEDPDLSIKKKVSKEKSSEELIQKDGNKKEKHLEKKEIKEQRMRKHKDSTKERKYKEKVKDSRPKEHSKDREKGKSKEKECRHSVDLNIQKKEKKILLNKKLSKPDEKHFKPEDKLEKGLMTLSPTKSKIRPGPKIDERAHMFSLFPRRKPDESSRKKILTFPDLSADGGTGFNLLDTIMSGMSTTATKRD